MCCKIFDYAPVAFVYIIQNPKGNLYKGFTHNIALRLNRHNANEVKTTMNKGPWGLVYLEAFLSEKDAKEEEKFLKSGKGRERTKYLLKNLDPPKADPHPRRADVNN